MDAERARLLEQLAEREPARAGKLTARERIELLLDEGSFVELDRFVTHRCATSGWRSKAVLGDGVVTGHGGRRAARLRLQPGLHGVRRLAVGGLRREDLQGDGPRDEDGAPVIGLNDSGGARIQEGVVSLGGYADIFLRNTLASGVVPQISRSWARAPAARSTRRRSPTSSHGRGHELHVRHRARRGQDRDPRGRHEGGARRRRRARGSRASRTSRRRTRRRASRCRELLSYLPQNNMEEARRSVRRGPGRSRATRARHDRADESPNKPYDMHEVISARRRRRPFLEVQPALRAEHRVGFARLGGRPVGVVANQPAHLAGCLDIDASVKAARFVRFCDAFNIPLVTFEDVPGFLPGHEPGARRHHQARREAALRVLRGDGAEGHGDHAQGLRRRVRRHEQQAHPRRRQLRVADGRDRRDGRRTGRSTSSSAPRSPRRTTRWPEEAELVAEYRETLRQPVHRRRASGYVDEVIARGHAAG
jgi:propionyl-CoA carboxylase beta chain